MNKIEQYAKEHGIDPDKILKLVTSEVDGEIVAVMRTHDEPKPNVECTLCGYRYRLPLYGSANCPQCGYFACRAVRA